jgi:cobalt-zinc-cadmium efflux system membrane fusion protein
MIDVPPQNLVSVSIPLAVISNPAILSGNAGFKRSGDCRDRKSAVYPASAGLFNGKIQKHFAELDYNRQKTLNQSQASSDKAMQQAQSEMNSQKILMNLLRSSSALSILILNL